MKFACLPVDINRNGSRLLLVIPDVFNLQVGARFPILFMRLWNHEDISA